MVFDNQIQQMRRPAGNIGIEQLITKALLNGCDGGCKPISTQLAEQLGGLAFGDQLRLELANRREYVVQMERTHTALRAGLPDQALLIIALQHAPTAGVVGDHLQHRFTLRADQLLVGQGAGKQVERLLELNAAFLQSLLVEAVTLHQMLTQYAGGPLAEAGGASGADPVAYRDDDVEIVVLELPFDLARSFLTNYREILGSCRLVQLLVFKDIFQVQADIVSRSTE